ncbi:2725_t:CDS:10 [Funneliformis caledonium]|uniref:2725_t:CDS:1 n=1 Tax=Funneliformis caledonium TaxID=1117310 RepID=A0A9N9BRR9_9GLOM|nr:2725_t:CDS:10 [Funneliformis caledonium]
MSTPKDRLLQLSGHLNGAEASEENKPRLCCKVCIITGAASEKGIGRATAWAFAKNGAKAIYVTDYLEDLLPQLAKEIQTKYPKVTVISRKLDAASEDDVKSTVDDAIKRFGRLDVFFANAGILGINKIHDLVPSKFMEVMRVNVLSVFLAIKHASTAMKITGNDKKQSGGSIIATASVAGLRSGAGSIDYSASKAAVINMIQVGAWHLANTNVRGLVETNMTAPVFDHARTRGTINKVGQLNPLQRYAVPAEIANVVLFLASDESSYVNGHSLSVDGGLSSSLPVVPGKFY